MTSDLLQRVGAATAGLSGTAFFRRMLRELTEQLPCSVAFLAVVDEERHERLRVAAWPALAGGEGELLEAAAEPSLAELLGDDVVANARLVRERFSGDPLFADPGLESAYAVPLTGTDGAALGHLGVMDAGRDGPRPDQAALLRILASRAAVEIDRLRTERTLRALGEEQGALLRIATLVAQAAPPERLLRSVTTEAGLLYEGETAQTVRYGDAEEVRVVGCWSLDGVLRVGLGDLVALADEPAAAEVRRTGGAASVGGPSGYAIGAPVVVDGRLWGAMTVSRGGEPFPELAEERLGHLAEIFAQAIANLEAREQLAASRARLVEAADRERRRLERNLHDGAQQRLVTLSLGLRIAETRLAHDPEAVSLLRDASAELAGALEELRELARGIHPAVLSDRGLVPALESLIARTPLRVELEATVGERLAEPVEVAAYYVVAEALTNVVKYAGADSAAVCLADEDGLLRIEVADDGVGGADADRGSGLAGLADRVEALGGGLEVSSPAGEGTRVRAEIPSRRETG